jgi:hypothetical protein
MTDSYINNKINVVIRSLKIFFVIFVKGIIDGLSYNYVFTIIMNNRTINEKIKQSIQYNI